ncbi:MAG: tripartite tricarboxylate transporter substrate binding protein [Burkholderiales bacterium]|nr:tripartite tricarboxylate transporter substrate binding protein [Burkholderiales bacterium]
MSDPRGEIRRGAAAKTGVPLAAGRNRRDRNSPASVGGSSGALNPAPFLRRLFLVLVALPIVAAHAQQPPAYPVKPLKLIIPFPAGGPTDILGRLLAQKLTEAWGQNVVIDNRPGGGGVIGAQLAVKSLPDGYTLYLGGVTTLVLATFTHKDLPYDPIRDFAPVTQATISPLMLMTHPSLPARSLKEFVAFTRARPGQINYASSGPGGTGHLAGELFQGLTKTKLVHVPYRGAPPALADLVSGEVQVMFGTLLAAVPQVRAGRLRALAVTGPVRSIAVPDVPTFAEAGLPGYDASSWNGVMVPAGASRATITRLNVELVRILRAPNVLDRLAADGPVAVGSSPEEFAAYIKSELAKWGRVVREAGVRID